MRIFLNLFFNESKGNRLFNRKDVKPFLSIILLVLYITCISIGTYSHAENIPTYVPPINGEYSGTLYVYGVPVSILMSISSNDYGLGHQFTLRGVQENLFIIGGNCDCLESGAILGEHGLFSECLGLDMGLMDQVELDGWFTDEGYRGELRLFAAGSDISIPSLIGIFELARQ